MPGNKTPMSYMYYIVCRYTPLRLFWSGIFFHGVAVNLIYEKEQTKRSGTTR